MCNVPASLARCLPLVLSGLLVAALAAGCGDASGVGRTFPVAGKVLLNNAPFTAKNTVILFKPDAARGNTSPFEPSGTVDAEGNYSLTTRGKNGAPAGWYKVVVTAREEAEPVHPKGPQRHRPVSKSLLPAKYGQAQTTDLSIEVVEKPAAGAYDLKLSR
ncbi:MAG TPA: hypothetical protein VFE78_06750 [Gemmataceae bacterium]|jgi:hypothetical protein|nr:hypothetical protein [Gemmataceae bacterium]